MPKKNRIHFTDRKRWIEAVATGRVEPPKEEKKGARKK